MWTRTEEGSRTPTRQPCWALSISVNEYGLRPRAASCGLHREKGERKARLGNTAAQGWLESLGWSPAQALLHRVPLPHALGKPPQSPCPKVSEAAPSETHRIQQALRVRGLQRNQQEPPLGVQKGRGGDLGGGVGGSEIIGTLLPAIQTQVRTQS